MKKNQKRSNGVKKALKTAKTKKTRPGRKAAAKNISIKDAVRKIKSAFGQKPDLGGKAKKKPFGGGGRKKKTVKTIPAEAESELMKIKIDERMDAEAEQQSQCAAPIQSPGSGLIHGFFYTDEKFISQFEDAEIIKDIRIRHPEFLFKANNDMRTRKAIMNVLEDEQFLADLLAKYQMNIMDFFKFLFRQEQSIFKTPFIKRIQAAIRGKSYNV